MSLFTPATRHQLRARIAFDGPTGSGKTFTMLAWARQLAGPNGRIAVVDTERRSASLYSDRFQFDTLEWVPPYDPRKLAEVLRAAEAEGYDVIAVDSLTHFWKGEGGTLDIVEAAGRRMGGNSYAGWQTGTPALRTLIDTMLGLDAHFLGTMRSKMEHVLVEDERGKKVPQKIGMQPEMRGDIEYEFTLCVSMDLDHRGTVTKSRCEPLADAMIQPGPLGTEDAATTFLNWLQSGAPEPTPADPDYLAALRAWLNSGTGPERLEVRNTWPVGVPQAFDAPDWTQAQAERLERVIRATLGDPPPEVADMMTAAVAETLGVEQGTTTDEAPADAPQDAPGGDQAPDAAEPADEAPIDDQAPDEAPPTEDHPDQVRRDAIVAEVQQMTPASIKAALMEHGQKINGSPATLGARLAAYRLVEAGLADDDMVAAVQANQRA